MPAALAHPTFSWYAMVAMATELLSALPSGLRALTSTTTSAMQMDTGATMPVISSPRSSSTLRVMLLLLAGVGYYCCGGGGMSCCCCRFRSLQARQAESVQTEQFGACASNSFCCLEGKKQGDAPVRQVNGWRDDSGL